MEEIISYERRGGETKYLSFMFKRPDKKIIYLIVHWMKNVVCYKSWISNIHWAVNAKIWRNFDFKFHIFMIFSKGVNLMELRE